MSSTFHPFPKLPTELRVKIWKAACFPRTGMQRGLHYVDVDRVKPFDGDPEDDAYEENMEGYDSDIQGEYLGEGYVTLRALKSNWNASPEEQSSIATPNRSAYMWDAGLWMACKESRNFITKYREIDGWVAFLTDPEPNLHAGWYEKPFPSTLVPHEKAEKWRPIVTPSTDIFCINTSNLNSVPRHQMKLHAPFLGTRKYTPMSVWNIALEYDPSWNTAFPRRLAKLQTEKSPRGLLASWLEGFLDEMCAEPIFWLIDKNVRWVARPGQDLDTLYRDCDGDYVQIDWDDTRDGTTGRAKGAVAKFMTSFCRVCDKGYGDEFWERLDMDPDQHTSMFDTKKHINLLVLRDNEVTD